MPTVRFRKSRLIAKNSAITLPYTNKRAIILYNSPLLSESMQRHELCHVAQLIRWGILRYYWKHIIARIKTRNLYASTHPIERECYDSE